MHASSQRDGRVLVARGADPDKDQSYMLARVQAAMSCAASGFRSASSESRTREQARGAGLAAAGRAESQEVCFVGGGDHRSFVERHGGAGRPGDIVTGDGRAAGSPRTACTGSRPASGAAWEWAGARPLFVISTDPDSGRVVAGPRSALARSEVRVSPGDCGAPPGGCMAKLRYRTPGVAATVRLEEDGFVLELDEPAYGVAPGQAAVLYDDDAVVGAGLIAR